MMMKLSEIKQSPLYPFSDFRTNDASFLMLEMYWTSLAFEALGKELSRKVIPISNAERDIDQDGSMPNMLMFWIPELQRGVRIMLLENIDSLPLPGETEEKFNVFYPLMVWLNKNGVYDDTHDIEIGRGIEQIEISSIVSDQQERYIIMLLKGFLCKSEPMEHVDKIWIEIQKEMGYPSPEELEAYYNNDDE